MQIGAGPSLSPYPLRVAPGFAALSAPAERPLAVQEAASSPVTEQAAQGDSPSAGEDPAQRQGEALADKAQRSQERAEQLEVAALARTDQEVRAHEQAHAAVGGVYAGAPSYTYTRGPDGKRYAVAGEVSIDTGSVPGDPQATMRKMQVVIRAALAPAEPSGADRQVAAQAQITLAQARVELATLQRETEAAESDAEQADAEAEPESAAAGLTASAQAGLTTYQQVGSPAAVSAQVDLLA